MLGQHLFDWEVIEHLCPSGLRGSTQVRMYSYSWVQIPPDAILPFFSLMSTVTSPATEAEVLLDNPPEDEYPNFESFVNLFQKCGASRKNLIMMVHQNIIMY